MAKELVIGNLGCKASEQTIENFLDELSIVGEVTDQWGAPLDASNFNGVILIKPSIPRGEAEQYVG